MTVKAIGSALLTATLVFTLSGCDDITASSQAEGEVDEIRDPGQVTDLRVVEATTGSLTVAFTEVDDGTGFPASYALRYGSPTVSWGEAHPTEVVVIGSEIGGTRQYEYNSLDPDTDHQFRLVAFRGTLNDGAAFGALSNLASGTTYAVGAGAVASVVVTPSVVTIRGVGNSAQLTAEAKDAEGHTVPEASFEWSSSDASIATVTQEGVVQANALGSAIITAAVICGSTACESSMEPNGSAALEIQQRSELYPNEPAGYTPWVSHDWQSVPPVRDEDPDRWVNNWPLSDVGYWTNAGHFGNVHRSELVDDPEAPHGYGKSLRITISEGKGSGGLLNWSLASAPGGLTSDDHVDLKEAYISYWFLNELHPSDGTFDSPGTLRNISINRHIAYTHSCSGQAEWIVTQNHNSDMGHNALGMIIFGYNKCENPDGQELHVHHQQLPHGQWHHVEMQWKRVTGSMTPEDPDGTSEFRLWMNGNLVWDPGAIPHRMANPFRQVHVNIDEKHSWGSSGTGTKGLRDDYIRYVGFYVSGIPH